MGLFKNSVRAIKKNENSNVMWLTIIFELVAFAFAIKFDVPLIYCSVFLIIPVLINIITNSFNLVSLMLCILELFTIIYTTTGSIENALFYSVLVGAGLSLVGFFKHNVRFKQEYKVRRTRTGRYK